MVERDGETVVAEAEVRHRVPRPGLVRRGGGGSRRRRRHGSPRRDPAKPEADGGEEGWLLVVECERGGGEIGRAHV